ncbi:hypothetical protein J2Y38_004563 [Flavobacterium sp. 2755]|uniref:hypothetical protein n=1 Tax=Flavobacterium sp. 2755 TaxID=2817765 RepID=UPI00285BC514|nr:hypothetical protein [Flavobacterium sp. 2755]MDR6764330.1 hypothetical protein [Flavobacterium sp. 2755]
MGEFFAANRSPVPELCDGIKRKYASSHFKGGNGSRLLEMEIKPSTDSRTSTDQKSKKKREKQFAGFQNSGAADRNILEYLNS